MARFAQDGFIVQIRLRVVIGIGGVGFFQNAAQFFEAGVRDVVGRVHAVNFQALAHFGI